MYLMMMMMTLFTINSMSAVNVQVAKEQNHRSSNTECRHVVNIGCKLGGCGQCVGFVSAPSQKIKVANE